MTYSSPSFGYGIGWQSPRYVTFEETEAQQTDYLVLSDGESTVYFTGKRAAVVPACMPDTIGRGEQLLVVASTAGRTDCAAVLQLADAAVRRETFSNAEGEVLWLLSTPETAQPGPAALWLGCGRAPVQAEIMVV
jgi:hypothetical protein